MQLNEDDEVSISILRIDGSVVSEYKSFMNSGVYALNICLAEPQVAFLSVSTRSGRSVAKLVNTKAGSANNIEVLHQGNANTKDVEIGPFNVGDQMIYTAVSITDGERTLSNPLIQVQAISELVTLIFEESGTPTVPEVTTSVVSDITSNSATCGGNVSNDGGETVTAFGVCWSTTHDPIVSDSHTTDGTGTGYYTSSISGLSANTTYYVRAYATNSIGTAYGEEMEFVTTTEPGAGAFDQNGASNAVFTVASGRTVHFSKGNLQYQASTDTWRFAENQWDHIGDDNANISSTYSGWIDLFGWGTSGWNSGANDYQPWATSTTYYNYYPGGSYSNNLTGTNANADWGVYNSISNGGDQAGMWRTLTRTEWSYLLYSRATATTYGDSDVRFGLATVNDVTGFIIFPDTYIHPSGVTALNNVNTVSASFSDYVITLSEWQQLEDVGCIFLPAAGVRHSASVQRVDAVGLYWTSSNDGEYYAWGMSFGGELLLLNGYYRGYGLSVRLVKD